MFQASWDVLDEATKTTRSGEIKLAMALRINWSCRTQKEWFWIWTFASNGSDSWRGMGSVNESYKIISY